MLLKVNNKLLKYRSKVFDKYTHVSKSFFFIKILLLIFTIYAAG